MTFKTYRGIRIHISKYALHFHPRFHAWWVFLKIFSNNMSYIWQSNCCPYLYFFVRLVWGYSTVTYVHKCLISHNDQVFDAPLHHLVRICVQLGSHQLEPMRYHASHVGFKNLGHRVLLLCIAAGYSSFESYLLAHKQVWFAMLMLLLIAPDLLDSYWLWRVKTRVVLV